MINGKKTLLCAQTVSKTKMSAKKLITPQNTTEILLRPHEKNVHREQLVKNGTRLH